MAQVAYPMPDPDDLRMRKMSTEELAGYRHACNSMMLWASQIERNARNLSSSGETVPLDEMMRRGAQMTRGLAEALERTSHL